jgi:hypothetical protein
VKLVQFPPEVFHTTIPLEQLEESDQEVKKLENNFFLL